MAFQGSLAELHLPDIIQLVSVSGKTGVFHLADGPHHGEIWLQEGRIVHAETEDLSGEEAVYSLAIWRSGEFRFEPNAAPPRQSIQKSNTGLLMEAARRLDEWRVLSKKIPSADMVPEFVVLENREGQINLNTMEWLLLSKIDGQRSVKQVAAAANMSTFDTAKLLYGLVATNLIRLKEAAAAPQPAVPQPAAPATPAPAPAVPAAPPAGASARPASSPPVHVSGVASPPAVHQTGTVRVGAATRSSGGIPRLTPAQGSPYATGVPASSPPTAARAVQPTPPAGTRNPDLLLGRLGQIREECIALLGPVGETVVHKHYLRARSEIERGAGVEAIDEAVQQIARAAGILKGSAAAEAIQKLHHGS